MSLQGLEDAAQTVLAAASVASAVFVGWMVKQRLDLFKTDPKSSRPLPPGSYGWPILGETLAVVSSGFDLTPWQKKYGKICKTSFVGRDRMALIFDPELIQEFFKKHSGHLIRPSIPFFDHFFEGALIQITGPAHKIQRTMLLPAFSARNMRRYVLRTQNLVQQFLDKWESAGQFNAQKELSDLTFMVSAAFFLGADRSFTPKIRELFDDFSKGGFSLIFKDLPFTQFRRSKRAHTQLMKYVRNIIAQRRQEIDAKHATDDADNEDAPTDPLWIMLSQKDQEGNYMTADKIATTALILLFAGFETTKSSLIAIMMNLFKYPEVRQKLRAEIHETIGSGDEPITLDQLNSMKYLEGFLQEVFRVMPAFLFNADRKTTQTVEVGDYQIPAGWYVACCRSIVSHDDSVFPNADKFDPERPPEFKVPSTGAKMRNMSLFGFGPYECLGKHFAQLERKVFTVMLLRHFEVELLSEKLPEVSYKNSFMSVNSEFPVRLHRL